MFLSSSDLPPALSLSADASVHQSRKRWVYFGFTEFSDCNHISFTAAVPDLKVGLGLCWGGCG